MASASVPFGNPAGVNQANPALRSSSLMGATMPTPNPIPGGSTPSPSNPYMVGVGIPQPGATSSGTVPSGTPAGTATYSGAGTPKTADVGGDPSSQELYKQMIDIYGKGTGKQLATMYEGAAGTESDIFKQWQAGQAPIWAQQKADFGQTMGAAGVSPNSTVEALGLTNLESQQAAQAGSVNAQLMQENQKLQYDILHGTQQDAASEVATSGWDVFGQVMGDIGAVGGALMGNPMALSNLGSNIKSIGSMFGGKGGVPSGASGVGGGITDPGMWA